MKHPRNAMMPVGPRVSGRPLKCIFVGVGTGSDSQQCAMLAGESSFNVFISRPYSRLKMRLPCITRSEAAARIAVSIRSEIAVNQTDERRFPAQSRSPSGQGQHRSCAPPPSILSRDMGKRQDGATEGGQLPSFSLHLGVCERRTARKLGLLHRIEHRRSPCSNLGLYSLGRGGGRDRS